MLVAAVGLFVYYTLCYHQGLLLHNALKKTHNKLIKWIFTYMGVRLTYIPGGYHLTVGMP